MKYRIEIPGVTAFYLYTSEFEQLGEAIARHIDTGFRDGETRWHGVVITECADGKSL